MEALQSTITFLRAEVESSDGEIKQTYETALKEAQAKLIELIRGLDISDRNKSSTSSETYKRNSQVKSIESALTEVTFKGVDINETTRFIERLAKVFMITVTGKDPTLETDFLDLVKLRLSDAVFKNLVTSQSDVSTFENLKNWLKTTYGGNFNAFQILQRAWDIKFKPNETFATYAQKVSEEMRTGVAAVRKQITAVKGEKQNSGTDPRYAAGHRDGHQAGLEVAMEFVSALLMSNNLRAHCWPLYKDMVNDMDTMLTSAEVANKAEYYRERLGSDRMAANEAYWTNPRSNAKPSPTSNNTKNADEKSKKPPKRNYNAGDKRIFDPKRDRNCRWCNQPHLDYTCPSKNEKTAHKAMHAAGTQQGHNGPAPTVSAYTPITPFH